MKGEHVHIIIDLLSKSLAGKVTPEERGVLNELIREYSLEELVTDLENEQYVMQHLRKYARYDVKEGFQDFLNAIGETLPTKKAKIGWRPWSAVAAVLLFVMSFLFFYFMENPQRNEMRGEGGDWFENVESVRLVLADREEMSLEAGYDEKQLNSLGIFLSVGPRILDYTRVKGRDSLMGEHTLVVPKGCLYKVILSDGTKVTLNADSRMRYPAVLGSSCRRVYLEGEAYFDVKQDENAPFFVEGRDFSVRVLGTVFNVMDYKDEKQSRVTLLSGSVEMHTKDTVVCLSPGKQVVVEKGKFMSLHLVDPLPYVSWMEDKFCFESERLENVLRKLGRWYDVDIECDRDEVNDVCFTGYIPNDIGLKEVLKLLEETADIEFIERDKKILVRCVEN